LHHRHVILVCDIGDSPQFGRRRHTATDAGHDRERTVLLDVCVDTIVDEPGGAILVVVAAPDHVEHVTQGRLADFAARTVAVDLEHLLYGFQTLTSKDLAKVVPREWPTAAEDLLAVLFEVGRDDAQDVLTERSAAAAAGTRPCLLLELRERVDAFLVNGGNDHALRDADASAD